MTGYKCVNCKYAKMEHQRDYKTGMTKRGRPYRWCKATDTIAQSVKSDQCRFEPKEADNAETN